jgi:hypothetical protein
MESTGHPDIRYKFCVFLKLKDSPKTKNRQAKQIAGGQAEGENAKFTREVKGTIYLHGQHHIATMFPGFGRSSLR